MEASNKKSHILISCKYLIAVYRFVQFKMKTIALYYWIIIAGSCEICAGFGKF